ncbi:helix-turn-helix domain-containing protein [Natronobiforma cellulositropha]|uniref:helix-turn-helix domain-containing protein n=1 Tax=Natronobiforma cellulositropha TaxID=1679076 RepID=UPI0021D5BFF4|nr:helix-turn-helix domain-containing protein [Natronobiforma cellulositropha]
MTGAIRAEIEIESPGDCPVAMATAAGDTTVEGVTRTAGTDADGRFVEEFALERGAEESLPADLGCEPVFDLDAHTVYRFSRDPDDDCVCTCIERFGWPVSDVRASEGALIVSCYATDVAELSALVRDLREAFGTVRVRQLIQSGGDADGDLLLIDRRWLTDRQREVLETAHEMGYFEYPKGANAGEVAAALGISRSTFSEHLAAAQRKLLDALVTY